MSTHVRRQFASFLLMVTFFVTMVGVARAATTPPNLVSYQGRVLNANGVPVTDASLSIVFKLYDASSGGTCLWSNSSSSCATSTARTVTLSSGLFSENLGDTAHATPYAAIADTVFSDNAAVYLGITIGSDSEMTPRKRMTAAPYALNAENIDGIDSTSLVRTSATENFDLSSAKFLGTYPFVFEGATTNSITTTFAFTDPALTNKIITFPNTTGTVVTTGDTGGVTSTMITDGTILNADINTSAAIDFSKFATLTSGNILVGSAGEVATSVALSGDATLVASGALSIASNVLDFDNFADALALDAATSITGAAGETFQFSRTLTNATAENGLYLTVTAQDGTSSTTSQYGLLLDNAASTEGLDGGLVLQNTDADDAVGAGILFAAGGAGTDFTYGIDFTAASFGTAAIRLGSNTLSGTTAVIDFTGFDVAATTGATVIAGSADGITALTLSLGDILVSNGDLNLSGGDFNVTLDATDDVNITKTAQAASTEEGLAIAFTTGAGDGQDVYSALKVTTTNAVDHLGTGVNFDSVYGINIGNLSAADSDANEMAIYIGDTWDSQIRFADTSTSISIENAGTITFEDGIGNDLMLIADGGTVGNVTVTGDLAVSDGDLTTTATTATLFNTNATTLSLGGAATTALNLGNGSGNYSAINIGSGTGTHTISIAGFAATGADNVYIGTGGGTDAIVIGSATGATSDIRGTAIDIGTGGSNPSDIIIGNPHVDSSTYIYAGGAWEITSAGLILMGANLESQATTINLFDDLLTDDSTIDFGGVTVDSANTINIATEGTTADTITIGNTHASSALNLKGGTVALTGAATTGTTTTSAFTLNDTALTSGTLLYGDLRGTSGTALNFAYGGAVTQSTGAFTGLVLDLTNLTGANGLDMTNVALTTKGQTRSGAGTEVVSGVTVASSGALMQDTAAGTFSWYGANITSPAATANFAGSLMRESAFRASLSAITGTAGSVFSNGFDVVIPDSAIVTGVFMNGMSVNGVGALGTIGVGPAAGTLNGIDIATITTPGNGTENAINIGSGWDKDINATTSFDVSIGGTLELYLDGDDFSPATSNGNSLGDTDNMWSDLFLASGGVINFDNSDVTLTHAANALDIAGGDFNVAIIDGQSINFDGDGTPTADIFRLGVSDTATGTDGIDLLTLEYDIDNINGAYIHVLTPGLTANGSDLINIMEVDAFTLATTSSNNEFKAIEIGNITVTSDFTGQIIRGLDIGNVSQDTDGNITANAINVGTGWDAEINLASTTPKIAIGATGTLSVTDGTNVLLDVIDDGTVGRLSVGLNGTATTNGLCHSGANLDAASSAARDIVVCSGAPADYAEWHETDGTVQQGDIVAITDTKFTYNTSESNAFTGEILPGTVQKTIAVLSAATLSQSERVFGVVSTSPNQTIGTDVLDQGAHPQPIALVGRIPVNVTNQNGAITAGDYITVSSTPGKGMKATLAGRVIGIALSDLNGVTGQVIVQVTNSWYFGSMIGNDGTSTLLTDNVIVAPVGTASASTTTFDSYGLALRGSAWNGNLAEAVSMMFKNKVTDGTNYRLSVRNTTDSEVAYITNAGTMQVAGDMVVGGKIYPSNLGGIQTDKYIYYDGSAGPGGDFIRTNASGWSTGSYDFAEMFPSSEVLDSGDVVVFSSTNEHVKRSTKKNERSIAGIVSTRPGFLAGENTPGSYPIALAGRVPTNVNLENGTIAVGDPLTTSSTEGSAMKATKAGPIVGYALEPFEGTQGKIIVFVSAGYWGGEATSTTPGADNRASLFGLSNSESMMTLSMGGTINMNGNEISNIGRLAGLTNAWSIEMDGTIKTEGLLKTVITGNNNQKVETVAVTSPEAVITLSGSATLKDGQVEVRYMDINPDFGNAISAIAPVRVVATPNGPVSLYVSEKDQNHFVVKSFGGNASEVEFDWVVTGYRKGFEPVEKITAPVVAEVTTSSAPVSVTEIASQTTTETPVSSDVTAPAAVSKTDAQAPAATSASSSSPVESTNTEPFVTNVAAQETLTASTPTEPPADSASSTSSSTTSVDSPAENVSASAPTSSS